MRDQIKHPAIAILLAICVTFILMAQTKAAENKHLHSPYAGEQNRIIKTLSPEDIQQLSDGRGWGLAKAAELNGIPGPAHLLEMKDEIALSKEQVEKIQRLFDDMKNRAQPLGRQLIDLEKELNMAFANKTINKENLKSRLAAIEKIRADLRYVHLVTHLETPSILSSEQIEKYNKLRGYTDDPCLRVPKGHDREMWLKHNGCK